MPLDSDQVTSARNVIPITSGDQIIEGIAISPDETRIGYDSNARGIHHLFVMPLSGGNPLQVTSGLEPDYLSDWSPYADELAFHRFSEGSRDVYTVSISNLSETLISNDPRHDWWPIWLGDANTLGFWRSTASRGRFEFVVSKRAEDGSWGPPELLVSQLNLEGDWSLVNRRLVYQLDETLYTVDPETGDAQEVDGTRPILARQPIWSKDGETIYFQSPDNDGNYTYWSVPGSGGTTQQIMSLDGKKLGRGVEAVDGNYLYFMLLEVESDLWVFELSD